MIKGLPKGFLRLCVLTWQGDFRFLATQIFVGGELCSPARLNQARLVGRRVKENTEYTSLPGWGN